MKFNIRLYHLLSVGALLATGLGSESLLADAAGLHRQLSSGSAWTLNLDGMQAPLYLSGGGHRVRENGTHLTSREVSWRRQKGGLKVLSDRSGRKSKVRLKIQPSRGGAGFNCTGIPADAKRPMMAGTCKRGDHEVPWFATRSAAASLDSKDQVPRKKYLTCVKEKRGLDAALSQRNRQLRDRSRELAVCKQKLTSGGGGSGKVRSYRQIARELTDDINRPLTVGMGGSADGVIELKLPSSPAVNSREAQWLGAVSNKLLSAIYLGLGDDVSRFRAAEQACRNVYCNLKVRANALVLMLGGTP
jgi:hypothetical protein